MTDRLITPGDLLAPRSPWLREQVYNFSGPNVPEGFRPVTSEGFRRTISAWLPDAEAVQRDADALRGTSSASKLLAGQLVAHHVLYKLVLPDCVLRALAIALGLQARHYDTRIRRAAVVRAYAAGRSTADIAVEHGMDDRSVRRLRGREAPPSLDAVTEALRRPIPLGDRRDVDHWYRPYRKRARKVAAAIETRRRLLEPVCKLALALTALPPRRHNERQDDARHMRGEDAKNLWGIVADLTGRDLVLPLEVFHAVIVALGLTDGRGRLRQQVIEDVLPERKPEQVVVGVLVDGQAYRLRDELPELEDADAEFLVHERPAEPRIGVRKRRDEYSRAVEFEAAARAKRFDAGDLTEQVLTAGQLARRLKRTDLTVIKNWTSNEQFQLAAYMRAYWMTAPRREARSKVVRAEARAIVRGEPQPSIESLAALAGVEPGVIATWQARDDWPKRLDSVVERAPAHWSDSRS